MTPLEALIIATLINGGVLTLLALAFAICSHLECRAPSGDLSMTSRGTPVATVRGEDSTVVSRCEA